MAIIFLGPPPSPAPENGAVITKPILPTLAPDAPHWMPPPPDAHLAVARPLRPLWPLATLGIVALTSCGLIICTAGSHAGAVFGALGMSVSAFAIAVEMKRG